MDFGIRVSRTAQRTGLLAIAQLRLKSPKPALVVGFTRDRSCCDKRHRSSARKVLTPQPPARQSIPGELVGAIVFIEVSGGRASPLERGCLNFWIVAGHLPVAGYGPQERSFSAATILNDRAVRGELATFRRMMRTGYVSH